MTGVARTVLDGDSIRGGRVANAEAPFECILNILPMKPDGLPNLNVWNEAFGHPGFNSPQRNAYPLSDLLFSQKAVVSGLVRDNVRFFVGLHDQQNRMPEGKDLIALLMTD